MPEDREKPPARAQLPVWRRLGWRLGAWLVLLVALGILLSGFLQYRAQDQLLRKSLGELLLNIARTGSLLVDGDVHEAAVAAGRTDTEAYLTIRKQLTRIQATNDLKDAVYKLSNVDGAMARFAVISMWNVPVGESYRLVPEIQPVLRRVLDAGTPGFTDIYHNEHGTWITAFAPIRNAAGKTVAALDVDFRADVYLEQLAAVRRRLYVHSLAAAVLALGAGIVLARHITRPVVQLAALARGVVEGDLGRRVRISARDEIGMLANVFYLMVERLQVSYRSLTAVVVRALESRGGIPGSLPRLAAATLALADRLGVTPAQRQALELGALLHDLGEIRTPEAILQKPGPLTSEERQVVALHPASGVDILETVPILTPALEVVGAHHERYDGAGYPQGIRGEGIPFAARIFSVVDALDAMTHDRPYRAARTLAEALKELRQGSGTQFDPRVVEAALTIPEQEWIGLLGLSAGSAGVPLRDPERRAIETRSATDERGPLMQETTQIQTAATAYVLAALRILYGILWIQQALWKVPPDFGMAHGDGLFYWTKEMVKYSFLPPHHFFVESVVLPHFLVFAWLTLLTELFIGTSHIVGGFTRLGALAAFGMSLNLLIGLGRHPGEWPWSYIMLAGYAVLFLCTHAGRVFGLDGWIARRITPSVRAGDVWGRAVSWLT